MTLLQHSPQKRPLQSPHLPPERLHLLPTVQRPPVIDPQTPHHLVPCLIDPLITRHLFLHPPLLQLPLQALNLPLHTRPTQISQSIPISLRLMIHPARTRRLIRQMWLSGGVRAVGGAVGSGGDGFFEVFEGFGGFGVETFELGGDAGLDVEFEVFGAGAVAFGAGLEGIDEVLGEVDGGFASGGQC